MMKTFVSIATLFCLLASVLSNPAAMDGKERKLSITIEHDENCGCNEALPDPQPTTLQPQTTNVMINLLPSSAIPTTSSAATTQQALATTLASTTQQPSTTIQPQSPTTAAGCPIDQCCTLLFSAGDVCNSTTNSSGYKSATCVKFPMFPPRVCRSPSGQMTAACYAKGCSLQSCGSSYCGGIGTEMCDPFIQEEVAASASAGSQPNSCPLDECCAFQCYNQQIGQASCSINAAGNATDKYFCNSTNVNLRPTMCVSRNGMPSQCYSKGCKLTSCGTVYCTSNPPDVCDPVFYKQSSIG